MLSDDVKERIRLQTLKYPDRGGALLPTLRIVQGELGHLSDEAVECIAAELDVPETDVYGTATFYSLMRREPCGRHVISICHNLTCTLLGAEPLIEHLEKILDVAEGEVTPDGRFSYKRIECIGRCDGAPAMLVNEDYHGDLTPEKLNQVLERYP